MSIFENVRQEEIDRLLEEEDEFDDPPQDDRPFPVFYMQRGDQMNRCNVAGSFSNQQQCANYCKSSQAQRCMHLRFDQYCTY